mmetsp:Transcript_30608/g.78121  ORF Transcript_30608/g.78121 Transcript_30608/m.78121 type:complete len:145 (-) Transcript_30608:172-606(-)|eukprot:CAMPEP_0202878562 /NCGR_PEP_ID=MMETSP1391-20130828/32367_1 /ASSEMBLY_ACC=CAM_ASM_000867 /TAXON_ID=1034604 /ORGANISM="Chlamydomonas leiostraca, Strain SAG 11-49" /LENGTH=144 /DNA_ID=CAMNT_0049560763 /DNA_START=100 /DNA_END=534 /DNA_ORIENTATION=+
MAANPQARVGVGVLLVKHTSDGPTVLVGRRQGSHGAGTWAVPGGHLELGESFEQCAVREIDEETAIQLDPSKVEFAWAVNSVFDAQRHYVTVFMRTEVPADTEAKLTEPDKCDGWHWIPYSQLASFSEPLFMPLKALLESKYKL